MARQLGSSVCVHSRDLLRAQVDGALQRSAPVLLPFAVCMCAYVPVCLCQMS